MTRKQAKLWIMFFDRMINEPEQQSWYLMRLIAEVRGFWSNTTPDANLFRIKVGREKPRVDDEDVEFGDLTEEQKKAIEEEKKTWIAALGGNVRVKNA